QPLSPEAGARGARQRPDAWRSRSMTPLLAQSRWEQVLASAVIGLGAALIAAGIMAVLPKRPPPAVGEDPPATPPRPAGMSKPVAFLLMAIGLGMAVGGFLWRTSLPL